VDLTGFAVARTFPLNASPTEVIADPTRPAVYALTPETGRIHQIRTDSLALGSSASVGGRSTSMRLTARGEVLWVLQRDTRRLVRVAPGSMRVEMNISLPAAPGDFDLSRDGNRAVVSFPDDGSIGFLDLNARKLTAQVPAGPASAVRFRSDGRVAIATQPENRQIWLYDGATGRLIVKLPVGLQPDHLCFSADGGQLFVTGRGMDAVVIVYPYNTPLVAETILAGRAPGPMAVSAKPPYLLVTNPKSGEVTILSIVTRKLVAKAAVGSQPGFVAVTPDDQYALVLNHQSGDMAVLRLAAIQPNRSKTAPLFTMIPVGSQPVCAAIGTA
jgi:DNA-binding beta-propeller fold protein YncE